MELICKEDEINTEELRRTLDELDKDRLKFKETQGKVKQIAQLEKWLPYQSIDETEVIKDISKIYQVNLTEARNMLSSFPEEPLIDNKPIPYIVKDLRNMRRKLKGDSRMKMSKTIDHLINAYGEHLNKCIDSIYWISPYKSALKLLTPDLVTLRKLEYIKDGDVRANILDNLTKMWEANIFKNELDYGKEYSDYTKVFKNSKKNIRSTIKDISHQSIRKSRQDVLDNIIIKTICNNPGISSNSIHSMLPKSYHRSTTPQTISKMLRRINATNVNGDYYILSDTIKKDLYGYVAGFIDSDGYITMDSSFSPRVGMIATGDRGRAFFQEMEKELKIGRLHLDQKVGENNRSQHRLNFYSQNDITKLLDKCLPHLRMKKEQGRLLQEAIKIKKFYKKEPWAKERVSEIFKLIKWENWKDARKQGAFEFEKYDIQPDNISKYKDNCKWELMNEMDSIVKEE
mgnify:CR=1 FL=1|tara:strand:+ start:2488 stop:3861 length:1374 start_codon:yes stop_codon:yes gene_type:complete